MNFIPPKYRVLRPLNSLDGCEELLERAAAVMYDGTSAEDLKREFAAGYFEAWAAGEGLVFTITVEHKNGRELFLYSIVGRGILEQGKAVVEDLKKLAAYLGCNKIGAEGIPRGWLRAATRLGFEPIATRYMMELK